MPQFISTVAMKDSQPFSTFKEAVGDFIPRLEKLIKSGTTAYILHEACFIIMKHDDRSSIPLNPYAVANVCHECDMVDGEGHLKPDAQEPSNRILYTAFII